MILTVKLLNAQGTTVKRDELFTLYASDLTYNPYHRQIEVNRDGTVSLTVPEGPVILHAKLLLPGFGFLWVSSDNCGAGYVKDAQVDFVRDAAMSRVHEVEKVLAKGGFSSSAKCRSLLSDAKAMLEEAGCVPNPSEYHLTALAAGMWAGELAAVERAKARIAASPRRDGFLFGCGCFDYPMEKLPGARELFDQVFNYTTLPFYLAQLEPQKEHPDYTRLDFLQAEFEKSGIATKGHPLWWAHTAGMPEWTKALKWDDGSIAREIDRVAKRSVSRYEGRIHYFDAINEAHDWCNAYNLTQEQEAEVTKLCCDAIHEANPEAKAVVNTCFLFGENVADGKTQWGPTYERNMTPYSYLERVAALGTTFDAVGLQLYFPARDMLAIDKLYDRFSVFGLPLHLTELGVPSNDVDVPPNTTVGDLYCLRYMYYGLWHEMGWNQRLQADWVEDFYTITYSRPEVEAATWWSFTDPGYVPAAGLLNENGVPKESYFRLRALKESWGF